MCRMKRMAVSLFILCFFLTSCTPRYSDHAKNATTLITQWLDSNGFDHTMSQYTMGQKLEHVTYNGKHITDILFEAIIDGHYGGGVSGGCEYYGYSNYWQGKNNISNYTASFFTRVDLTGLALPFDLKIGSSIHELLSHFDTPALDFRFSPKMILCKLENQTVLCKHIAFAEHPYCIELTQVYQCRNSQNVSVSVTRTASFLYSAEKTLHEFSVSIEEIHPLR